MPSTESRASLTCPSSSEFSKNNARNIKHMAVLIFRKFFDFEQVSAGSVDAYPRTSS